MPNCPKCNSFIREGQKFCTKCGVNLVELAKPKTSPELAASVDIQEKKIAQDSLNPKLYIKLGDTYRDYKFYEEALVQYQKAVSIDETNAEAHFKSGDIYFVLGKLDRAKNSYEKALKLNPDLLEAKVGLFSVLKTLDLFSEALELGKEIVKIEPKNISAHKGLKEIYIQRGKVEEAIEELKTIIALAPIEKEAYKQLAQLSDKEKSFENYKKVLELDTKDKEALSFIGHYQYDKGNYDEAIKYFEELLALEPTNISVRSYLVLSYLKKDDLDEAAKAIDAIDISVYSDWKLSNEEKSHLSDIYFALGNKFFQVGKLENSKTCFRNSLLIFRSQNAKKGLAKVFAMEGDTAFANKKYETAQELYDEALQLDRSSLEYQEKLSKVKRIVTSKHRETAVAILVPLAFILIGVVAFFLWRHFTTGQISINYSTNEVTKIEIDGKEYNTGFIRLKKGEHEVVVKSTSDYFDTTFVFTISTRAKKTIPISLHAKTIYNNLYKTTQVRSGHRFTVQVKMVDSMSVASIAKMGPYGYVGETMSELFTWLNINKIMPAGPPFGRFYDDPAKVKPESTKYEVCIPVQTGTKGDKIVKVKKFGPTQIAMTLYVGPYAKVGPTYQKLAEWIMNNNYVVAGPAHEFYLNSPEQVPAESLKTEVGFPVRNKHSTQPPSKPARPRSEKLSSSEKIAERARRRLERERRREERKRRTGAERTGKEIGFVVKGIFVDERGEKYAIIGDRRAKVGDMVAGRRIQEIETDRVKVEYGGSIYEVRIGNALF